MDNPLQTNPLPAPNHPFDQRFRKLVEHLKNHIALTDAHGKILYSNAAIEPILGYSVEEYLALTPQDLLHPEDFPKARAFLRSLLAAPGTTSTAEFRNRHKQGHYVWIEMTVTNQLADPEIGALVLDSQDISARKQAEDTLGESEGRYRSLFEHMLNGYAYCQMLFDQGHPQDFVYLDVNAAFESLTGLKDVVGKKVSEVIPGIRELDPVLFETYGRVALTGQPETIEIYVTSLAMWFSVAIYSPQQDYFVAVFDVITERKQAEAALRSSEIRFRALIEKSSEAVILVGADGLVIYDSPSAERVTGFAPSERTGRRMLDQVHPDDRNAMGQLFGRLIQKPGGTTIAYLRIWHRDQSWHWIEGVATNLLNEPNVGAIVINYRDISERKHIEEELARYRDHLEQLVELRTDELHRAKRRVEAILNNTSDGVVLAHPQQGIERANGTFLTMFACQPDTYLGQPLLMLVQPEDRDPLAALIASVFADGVSRHDEFRALRADNTVFEAQLGLGYISAEDEIDAGLVCSIQDISALKQRERQLRYHASLQETVSDAVIATDLQLRIQSWNRAAERIYGWHAEEVLGKSIGEIIPTEFKSNDTGEQIQHDFQEKGYWTDEVIQHHKDGRALHILSSTVLFTEANGQPFGVIAVNRDITERKKAELALTTKTDEERTFQTLLRELHDISLELTLMDPLEDFYKRVIELGRTRFGFDRLALFLYDAETGTAQGTYGTDRHGHIRDEHALRVIPNPQGVMMRALGRAERFYSEEPTPLYDDSVQIGVGWNAAAALWNGTRTVGWLVADNLIEQKPASKPLLEILALYALTVATQLARKQVVTELRESEEKFRLFVEAAPEAIVICNREEVISLVNAEAERIFGYKRDELIGKSIELLVPEAYRDTHRFHRDHYAAAPYRRHAEALPELPARRRDGSQFTAAIQLSAVQTPDDLLVISFIADISERKRAEKALQESDARLRESQQMLHTVLETLPVRVFWKDRNSNLLGGNLLYAQDMGFTSSDQLVGKNDLELPSREQAAEFRADDKAVIESGIPRVQIEEKVTMADGSTVWVQTNKIPLRDSDGKIIGVIGAYVEITKHKQAEEELRRALEQQKELVDLKSRFISMASHDFRNPLAVILTSLSLLETQIRHQFGTDILESLQKRLGRIDESVQQMTTLLDDVLAVNRADTGKVKISPALIEIDSFCTEILQEIQITASPQHHLTLSLSGETTHIISDKQLLRQILVNLLSNAVKYSPEGGEITFNVHCEPETVEFQVQDEGIGIPEQDQEHLFETFHRAHNVGDISGTGLGMAITKRAVDSLGGMIGFESQVEVGTTFVVRLPTVFAAGRNPV